MWTRSLHQHRRLRSEPRGLLYAARTFQQLLLRLCQGKCDVTLLQPRSFVHDRKRTAGQHCRGDCRRSCRGCPFAVDLYPGGRCHSEEKISREDQIWKEGYDRVEGRPG